MAGLVLLKTFAFGPTYNKHLKELSISINFLFWGVGSCILYFWFETEAIELPSKYNQEKRIQKKGKRKRTRSV